MLIVNIRGLWASKRENVMTSKDHSSSRRFSESAGPSAAEEGLKTERLQIERKAFIFALKENPRGRFLRITEDVGGRRDSIIVPATGLEEFKRVIDDMAKLSSETPAKTQQP
jgi:FtsZ-interacting cell division protein ZipA